MRTYKSTVTDKVLGIGVIVAFIIIISVGSSIGKPVIVDSWDVEKINYFMMKSAELSVGFIVSTFFYYLLVVIEHRKYMVVRKRIESLIKTTKTHQERVINNLIRATDYPRSYDDLDQDDIKKILLTLETMIESNNDKFMGILDHWYRYTLYVENYLTKILSYYKGNLTEEALISVEEALESLYLDSIKRLPEMLKNWGNAKLENIAIDMSGFDQKIRRLHLLI